MSTFIIIPKYKSKVNPNVTYNSPSMIVEANNHEHANNIAEQTSLARFDEWSFHVAPYHAKVKGNGTAPKKVADPNSKSQKGKLITRHEDSRPVRRALRRLKETKSSLQSGSHHKGGAIKMW